MKQQSKKRQTVDAPTRARVSLHDAPLAVTSAGAILLGIHWSTDADDIDAVIVEAVRTRRAVWVGVLLTGREATAIKRDLDDAAHDTVMRLGSPLIARRRRPR